MRAYGGDGPNKAPKQKGPKSGFSPVACLILCHTVQALVTAACSSVKAS